MNSLHSLPIECGDSQSFHKAESLCCCNKRMEIGLTTREAYSLPIIVAWGSKEYV
jgi:hypothetical protein